MSDLDLMRAIISENHSSYRIDAARATANALHEAGFRLTGTPTDTNQNMKLAELEQRITRLEGWAGLPI
jgi:hypothetical protein